MKPDLELLNRNLNRIYTDVLTLDLLISVIKPNPNASDLMEIRNNLINSLKMTLENQGMSSDHLERREV